MSIIRTRSFPLLFRGEREKVFQGPELKKFMACVIFAAFSMFGLLFYLWPNVELLRNGFQYNGLLSQKERLVEENKALRLEISALKSMDRIERIARGRLNMAYPKKDQLFYVKVNNNLGKTR